MNIYVNNINFDDGQSGSLNLDEGLAGVNYDEPQENEEKSEKLKQNQG
jgi:hypothetical protein